MIYSFSFCFLLSCNSADDAAATSGFPTASAGSHATGDLSAVTGDQFQGLRCSAGGRSPADRSRHVCFSVQHFCSSSPDGRTLHQSCHRRAPPVCCFCFFDAISFPLSTCFYSLRSSVPPPWELSPSFSVPSPPLPSSPVPCPTWLVSPVRSSQMPKDRQVPSPTFMYLVDSGRGLTCSDLCSSTGNRDTPTAG